MTKITMMTSTITNTKQPAIPTPKATPSGTIIRDALTSEAIIHKVVKMMIMGNKECKTQSN